MKDKIENDFYKALLNTKDKKLKKLGFKFLFRIDRDLNEIKKLLNITKK